MLVPFELERPNSCGEGRISRESAMPQPLPNFGGSLLFLRIPSDAELPNLTRYLI